MAESWAKLKETSHFLDKATELDLDWSLYPTSLKDGCISVGKALNLPTASILSGYCLLGSYLLSPVTVCVPGTEWSEPVLLWLTICMPPGSGKSTLFRHLYGLLQRVRDLCHVHDNDPVWVVGDATFEKMGALMNDNSTRLLGIHDELTTFLGQLNIYRRRRLTESHELSVFLQLFNGHPWRRDTVTGEANFVMSSTNLTVGGFTQPGVARSLIEQPSNADKGLSHRFMWMFPKMLFGNFKSLGEIDKEFYHQIATLLARQWQRADVPGKPVPTRQFQISEDSSAFTEYYDHIQENLRSLAGMDEFLAGMLSKSRSHVLRLATVLHVLFNHLNDGSISHIISEEAIRAAINFVQLSCEQTAIISGKGGIKDMILKCQTGYEAAESVSSDDATAAYCFLLPGKKLYLTPLLAQKKFRKRGNKEGAVRAMYQLEEEGLGKTLEVGGNKGTAVQYEFEKADIPKDNQEFSKKLLKYKISLLQYSKSLQQNPITCNSPPAAKRAKIEATIYGSPTNVQERRTSPRKTPQKLTSPRKTPQKLNL